MDPNLETSRNLMARGLSLVALDLRKMASGQIPVLFNESLNLTAVGVSPDAIKFGSTSMESDKFITVCTQDGQIVIVDMANGNQVKKRPIKAEAAIMNPKSEVLALRSGTTLQVSCCLRILFFFGPGA